MTTEKAYPGMTIAAIKASVIDDLRNCSEILAGKTDWICGPMTPEDVTAAILATANRLRSAHNAMLDGRS